MRSSHSISSREKSSPGEGVVLASDAEGTPTGRNVAHCRRLHRSLISRRGKLYRLSCPSQGQAIAHAPPAPNVSLFPRILCRGDSPRGTLRARRRRAGPFFVRRALPSLHPLPGPLLGPLYALWQFIGAVNPRASGISITRPCKLSDIAIRWPLRPGRFQKYRCSADRSSRAAPPRCPALSLARGIRLIAFTQLPTATFFSPRGSFLFHDRN